MQVLAYTDKHIDAPTMQLIGSTGHKNYLNFALLIHFQEFVCFAFNLMNGQGAVNVIICWAP